jgi:MAF protein
MKLVLASNSPRRKQILTALGWDFLSLGVDFDESRLPGEAAQAYVLRLAEGKAQAARPLMAEPVPDDMLIVAADTAVVVDSDILGKPVDVSDAQAMLSRLRSRSHQVLTGLAGLRVGDGTLETDVCTTQVQMRDYTDSEMEDYIATGDPFDKAGAYAIQHRGFNPVAELVGCRANVAGLPVCRLIRLVERLGFNASVHPAFACNETAGDCPVFEQLLT